jgi:hypothetical protein
MASLRDSKLPNVRLDTDRPAPVIRGLILRGADAVHVNATRRQLCCLRAERRVSARTTHASAAK